ncbi:hypothetical protein EST38_g11858 [Candolleomyces aberdarensis]|uniref:BTB domain-containing protein n=1 Tax=Candolleomyces aberdarensis TaxID=2316362 RepID=A0A4Q2D760_9AGAR|nr:hypothetical protein EST38_g11858 [Candolleomyces aberdarensis]
MTRPESMTSPRWSTVFFKVENSIFEVPRHRFTEYSEIFEDMFSIPQAGDGVEGKDEGHPITLDGYESADFRALITVLYPAPLHAVVSGSYTITKEEWVGVLNLSTRWRMKEIRKHAINELSKMSLGPLEKVVLARAHKVGKWLEEGLNEIVVERPVRCPEELKSQLGLETAFLLIFMMDYTDLRLKLPDAGGNSLPKMEVNINDAFKEEIASYESWYQ